MMGPLAGGLGDLGGWCRYFRHPGLAWVRVGRPEWRAGEGGTTGRAAGPGGTRTEVYEGVVQDLIDELGQLPGVGPKGAQRIAFHLLTADPQDVRRLAATLVEVTEKVKFCAHLRQRLRERRVPDLPGYPARSHGDLRGRRA